MMGGVRYLLKELFDLIYMVADEHSLADAVVTNPPDLVIVDLSMPVSSAQNVARLLHRLNPDLRFIVLSVHDEQIVADECLAAGAKGFVLKRTAVTDLIAAVETVLRGGTYVSPSIEQDNRILTEPNRGTGLMANDRVNQDQSGLVSVVERFPEKRKSLERLFERDKSFRSLCEEYVDCRKAYRFWQGSSLPEAPDLRNDFSSLQRELEEEILEYLGKETPA
jgi:DNA-binding NarL/FixJ family response regulator